MGSMVGPPLSRCTELMQRMWQANLTWDSSWIIGELQKLGIEVVKLTVEKYHIQPCKPPPRKSFLHNHVADTSYAMRTVTIPLKTRGII